MFGFFKKDFEIHIDSAINHYQCSEFYKMGISTNNPDLIEKYKHTYKILYEKLGALKRAYLSYLVNPSGQTEDKNDKSFIRDIVHFITYCDAFAYGYAGYPLDERTLRKTAKSACSMLFEDTHAFRKAEVVNSSSSYSKKFSVLEEYYFLAHPSETQMWKLLRGNP